MYNLGFLVFILFKILCFGIFKILHFNKHRLSYHTGDIVLLCVCNDTLIWSYQTGSFNASNRKRNGDFCSAASPKDELTIAVQSGRKTGSAGVYGGGIPLSDH